jgi:hypothetical protein
MPSLVLFAVNESLILPGGTAEKIALEICKCVKRET